MENTISAIKIKNRTVKIYGDRLQEFWWANDMGHIFEYTNDNGKKVYMMEKVNLVVCNESWTEYTREGDILKRVKFAWVSARRITVENVHRRCNLIGRYRWFIENNIFQTEKCRGYNYEHSYSYNWQAMKGFYHLMHKAHILNNLVLNTEYLWEYVKKHGFGNTLGFLYETWTGRWIDGMRVERLIEEDN